MIGEPNFFAGVRIHTSQHAVKLTYRWEVHRHPIAKRRRGWRVVRVEERTPCVFKTPSGLFMHPVLFAKLKQAMDERYPRF
jgi:hypothetical protein